MSLFEAIGLSATQTAWHAAKSREGQERERQRKSARAAELFPHQVTAGEVKRTPAGTKIPQGRTTVQAPTGALAGKSRWKVSRIPAMRTIAQAEREPKKPGLFQRAVKKLFQQDEGRPTLFEAVFGEAYDPKREPTERDKEFAARKQEVLKKYQGRTHKSGRPVKSIAAWAAGKPLVRDTHERARWKATERPAGRGQSVRAAARAEIEAPEKKTPGPREGLSKGKKGGVVGKTYREKQKPASSGHTRSTGPKKGPHWNESPGRHEVDAREEDPAKANEAAEKLKMALLRMKQVGRENPVLPEPEAEKDAKGRRWVFNRSG